MTGGGFGSVPFSSGACESPAELARLSSAVSSPPHCPTLAIPASLRRGRSTRSSAESETSPRSSASRRRACGNARAPAIRSGWTTGPERQRARNQAAVKLFTVPLWVGVAFGHTIRPQRLFYMPHVTFLVCRDRHIIDGVMRRMRFWRAHLCRSWCVRFRFVRRNRLMHALIRYFRAGQFSIVIRLLGLGEAMQDHAIVIVSGMSNRAANGVAK